MENRPKSKSSAEVWDRNPAPPEGDRRQVRRPEAAGTGPLRASLINRTVKEPAGKTWG
ncbi:hypothetical protein [Streptomyces sp. NPDC088789]|uniref:hypothetical protein n=1 Tax=Streptomyces sp. NPDC088789 TaxID=3365899 RepID=UPI0038134B0C